MNVRHSLANDVQQYNIKTSDSKRDKWLPHSLGRQLNNSHYVANVNTNTAKNCFRNRVLVTH
jgi:hypothetical protein